MQASDTLIALLDDSLTRAPEYGPALSSHLPMALVALARLGAGDDRLRAFAATYGARLGPAPAHEDWPLGDAWAGRLGDETAFAAYRDLFTQWLLNEGAGDTLAQVLPQLMPGCAGAAFHGLIRAAYAVQVGHRAELASALAYWASRWQSLPALPDAPRDTDDPERLLRTLPAVVVEAPLIATRTAQAAEHPAVLWATARLRCSAATLAPLARLGAYAYAESGNFTALHLATSAHALRVLLPHLDDDAARDRAVGHYWQAFAATVASARLALAEPLAPLPWAQIARRALASDDDHVIKLVDSMREQAAALGSTAGPAPWQAAATRAVAGRA